MISKPNNLNSSKYKFLEPEEFPKVMGKQEKEELYSIMDKINRENEKTGKGKIGINFQYSQIKVPISILKEMEDKIKEYNKIIIKEEKEEDNSITNSTNESKKLFTENKRKEEQLVRKHRINLADIDKNIHKINNEEQKIKLKLNSITTNINEYKENMKKTRNEQNEISKEKNDNFDIVSGLEKVINKSQIEIEEKGKKKKFNERIIDIYEKKKNLKEKGNLVRKNLCYACHKEIRKMLYLGCLHLAICYSCFNKNKKKFIDKCPICSKKSEMTIGVDYKKKDDDNDNGNDFNNEDNNFTFNDNDNYF